MNSKLSILIAGVLAVLVLAVLLAVLPVQVGPARADAVVNSNTVQVLAFRNLTTTQAGYVNVSGYGQADCYAQTTSITPTGDFTVTFTLLHSADHANWVPLITYADQLTTSVDFTRTILYGNYLRAVATVDTTGPAVTGNVVCVLKNVQ